MLCRAPLGRLDQRGGEIRPRDGCTRSSRVEGDVSGAAGEIEPVLARPWIEMLDQRHVHVADDLGDVLERRRAPDLGVLPGELLERHAAPPRVDVPIDTTAVSRIRQEPIRGGVARRGRGARGAARRPSGAGASARRSPGARAGPGAVRDRDALCVASCSATSPDRPQVGPGEAGEQVDVGRPGPIPGRATSVCRTSSSGSAARSSSTSDPVEDGGRERPRVAGLLAAEPDPAERLVVEAEDAVGRDALRARAGEPVERGPRRGERDLLLEDQQHEGREARLPRPEAAGCRALRRSPRAQGRRRRAPSRRDGSERSSSGRVGRGHRGEACQSQPCAAPVDPSPA